MFPRLTEARFRGAVRRVFKPSYAMIAFGILCAGVAAGLVDVLWVRRFLGFVNGYVAGVYFCSSSGGGSFRVVDDAIRSIREFRVPGRLERVTPSAARPG